jgi:hypothetical protein
VCLVGGNREARRTVTRSILAVCCLVRSLGAAVAQVLELEGRYWPASLSATVRVTGGSGEIPGELDVCAEASGISAGSRGHARDAEAGLRLTLGTRSLPSAGYRDLDVEMNDDPDCARLKNAGPFLGAGLRL